MYIHRNSSSRKGRTNRFTLIVVLFVGVIFLMDSLKNAKHSSDRSTVTNEPVSRNPISELIQPPSGVERKPGVAAAILMDVSGSMESKVLDSSGVSRAKIELARNNALRFLGQIQNFTSTHPDQTVRVGIYEFSVRDREPACREVVPLGELDMDQARAAVQTKRPKGGTPIGDAMISVKKDLDRTGLTHEHILVVTEGENTRGYEPSDVVNAITRLPDAYRASVYFIAFDVAAEKFRAVRDAGGLVLSAANETDLQQTMDYILTGKILAEQPEAPQSK